GGGRKEVAGYTVISYPARDTLCERRILLADGNAVLVGAWSYDSATPGQDLCAMAEAGTTSVLTRLGEQGIGSRERFDAHSTLARTPACGLLADADLAAVPGAGPPRTHFGDWGCDWSFASGDSVAVSYYRGFPLGEADGRATDFAGHPGTVLPREGDCWVQFVQRTYTVGESDRIEAVWVTYHGSGSAEEMCGRATAFATAAARRLPPPG
ncbi:MAG: hypothetical protein ACRDQ0_01470, partial [Pseudonocardia sp.]